MPRNICQSEKVADHDIAALCLTCLSRPSCMKRAGVEAMRHAAGPGENKLFMVTECDEFRPRDDMKPFRASLHPNLVKAGVTHCCHGCPREEMGECRTYDGLMTLTLASKRGGLGLEVTVVCCSSHPNDRLYQIGEPSPQP